MLEHLIRQRDYLLDISRAITSQLSLSEVLRRILQAATEMLGGQAGLIALADSREAFTVRASYGVNPAVLHLFAPLLTDIPRSDPESFAIPELDRKMQLVAHAAGLGLHQVVALPMTIGSEMVGVVYIFREYGGRFDRNEIRLLQSFADQAAIAVHNARLYEQMSTEKQRLDAILRHSADGILILSPDLHIESINLALARMTGWQVEDVAGMHHNDIIRWSRRGSRLDLNEAVAGGWPLRETSVLYVEGDLLHLSGSALSVGITYAPLFDKDSSQLHNIIANVRDITRFREAEEAKTMFLSMISHELKTPVSVIKGYASTLNREEVEWDRQTLRKGLTVIDEETDRLAELIDNLLDVSRLQIGTFRIDTGQVDFASLAVQVAEKFRPQTPIHTIETHFPPDFPEVQGDERRLGQVLSNLVNNAIKYSPQGGTISICGRVVPNAVQVSVSDEGVGLLPEQQELIFDRFYRVDNALTRETQGVGLGLYIVRSIVEAHGGHIWVESKPGQGTTFTMEIPFSHE
jgi:PAS domain S-box-containing protein